MLTSGPTCEARPRKTARALPFLSCLVALLSLALLISACQTSGETLADVRASATEIVLGSSGVGKPPGALEVRYTLGKRTAVVATLAGASISGYTLLDETQDAGEHVIRFSGVITATDEAVQPGVSQGRLVRRVVPPGGYRIEVQAGGTSREVGFTVGTSGATETAQQPPTLHNLVLKPETISPNSDAVDDVAELTFRTGETATLSVDLLSPQGTSVPVLPPTTRGPGEQNVVLDGHDALGRALPDGVYTATLRMKSKEGAVLEAQRPLEIHGGGEPAIRILKVEISPQRVMLGNSIEVSITVKNVGSVPLRTQGPDPGYEYTTNSSYSSIEEGNFVDKAGLWRVGVDWDGNSGGGPPYRYPFRWGFGHTLMPGETVVTGGRIKLLKQEHTMWFYAGVLQEGVRIVLDRLGRTKVEVGF